MHERSRLKEKDSEERGRGWKEETLKSAFPGLFRLG